MAKADSVHSTPPTNTSVSRRKILGAIAAASAVLPIAAAMPVAAPALPVPQDIAPVTATPVDPSTTLHPDAKLLELGLEYERLWAIEGPLEEKSGRLWNVADRVRWEVAPTGNYTADCETGHAFAIEFLKSCDGTQLWAALVSWIVLDMIRAGPETNGIIVGFMSVIGNALATVMTRPGQGGAA